MSAGSRRLRLAESSLALRVALASAVFAVFIGALAAGSGYWALSYQLDSRRSAELQGKSRLTRHLLSEMNALSDVSEAGHRFGDLLIGHDNLHLAVIDPRSGRLLAGFSPAANSSAARLAAMPGGSSLRWRDDNAAGYESLKETGAVKDGQPVHYVLSLDLQADHQLLAGYLRATLVALPAILLLMAIGAWAVARTGLGPLKRFARTAAGITSNTLNQRLPRQGLPAEIGELADGFNAMLGRIDESVGRLAEFSADLAHEMRTPVATLLGRTQVALSMGRTIDELRDVLAANVEELERMTRLIADMLFLAGAEQGGATLERIEIDLAMEARRVVDFLTWVAEERGVSLRVSGLAKTQGDRIMVQRAITNLLSNAIRHAAPGSVVDVELDGRDAHASVMVRNVGETIAPNQQQRIFERLVRLDAARARADGGSGLGLAIVRSIMRLHGGDVSVKSADRRTEFVLSFPGSGSAGAA